ncbi:MAG: carboxylating nicotinate-nucleotide diphosphorylase [Chloroflexota bacterium]
MNEKESISRIIRQALLEDIGDGDITTQATVASDTIYVGEFLAKASGVVAGLDVAEMTFGCMADLLSGSSVGDKSFQFTAHVSDGAWVEKGSIIATITGLGQILLTAERVALNFMQRMSGIATLTHRYVEAIEGTQAAILDTRKTVPGLRMLDKQAVAMGGGKNHRIGLYDMVMIKENHVAAAGGVTQAVAQVRTHDKRNRPIEVEVQNLTELAEVLPLNVDQVMLDNMSLADMRTAVEQVNGQVPLEASGNVSLETVQAIAETGVDYISVGKLTHSVAAFDISFLLRPEGDKV